MFEPRLILMLAAGTLLLLNGLMNRPLDTPPVDHPLATDDADEGARVTTTPNT